jgi:1-deoxy-D-xylulose-5-phosphate synthase
VNARFVKPLDEAKLLELAGRFEHLFSVEEGALAGGFGSAIMECFERLNVTGVKVHRLGIPDRFIDHATQAQQRRELRLDAVGIAEQVRSVLFATGHVAAGEQKGSADGKSVPASAS